MHPLYPLVPVVCFAATALSVRAADQISAAQANADAAATQAARNNMVTAHGSRAYYDAKLWNLDDLPHYVPERQVSGTIREWGSNYFTDSPLASYWETQFRRYQPGVRFDDHLKTSEHAISALCFGISDLGPLGRQITWDERLAFQRAFDYQPTGVVVVTGSYDVSGWNPAIGIFINAKNPLARLSLHQLDGIFGAPRSGVWRALDWVTSAARSKEGNIRTWGQLGLGGAWAGVSDPGYKSPSP